MPKLDTLTKTNKFTKSNFRPWNFMEQLDEEIKNNSTQKPLANQKQTVSIKPKTREQTKSKPLAKKEERLQSVSNAIAEPLANQVANQKQTVSDMLANPLDYLTGKEKILVKYLFKKCQTSASLETPPITTDELKTYLSITAEHLRNLIFRVSHKNIITISAIKNGRSGWRKFSLNKDIFQQMSLNESVSNSLSMREYSVTTTLVKPLAEPLATPPSSSSLNKSTTEESISDNTLSSTLPTEWDAIDFVCLEDIGFNKNKLQQIYGAGQLTAEIVQESLYAYDFDRQHNGVKHNNPIGFLMSQLKVKGLPYDLPKNYESPRERAMRRYLEQKQVQRERSQQLHDMLKQESFEEWLSKVSPEEQDKLSPSHAKGTNLRRAALMHHYEKEHWPEKEKTILALVSS